MAEELIGSLIVIKEDLSETDTGGGYRVVDVVVTIDKTLPPRRQRVCLVYEILGAFLGSAVDRPHIEEISEAIICGLDELGDESDTERD